MGSGWKACSDDDERSVIGDKSEIGFIDYQDDHSVCSYNPEEEGPIVISVPFPMVRGKPQSVIVGKTAVDKITIKNTTSEPIDLWTVRIFSSSPENSFTLSLMEPPPETSDVEALQGFLQSFCLEDRVLQPQKTLNVWLLCKTKEIGLHTTAVHFDVGDDRIERMVFLLAEDSVAQSIAPNKPFSRAQRKNRYNVTEYVAGSRPARASPQSYQKKLPQYHIPANIRATLEAKQVPEAITRGLSRENYGAFFSTLIIMEELKMEEEMKGHDMECVTMWRKGTQFLALEVPGLAERRPSLVHGDFVFAKLATDNPDDDTRAYQGFIHRVEADEVLLKFSNHLHMRHHDGDLYNIRFTYNRTNMRRLYQAIQDTQKLETELLFPSESSRRRSIKAPKVTPLNLCLNEEQKCCVEMILGCKGAPPYVIHGPPGTGKTLTLVETILQLYTTRPSARVLVCASSNSAADHILDRLIGTEVVNIKEHEVFRLNAASRPYDDVSTDHRHFCYSEDFIYKCPPIKALLRYRIVISTYMSSCLLYAEGIKRGHFSHIVLDEAGQASEPETMIPISHLARRDTVVVLAGDPMQLGPVIYSREAETYGLGKSYLERLFECGMYHSEDVNFVIKLVRNYRCHQAILELPSNLFYKGELVACKEEVDSSAGAWENILANKDFPVLFVGIQGCDEREGNNPSWFNRIEVSKVIDIIQKLTASEELTEEDIGVITPYRQQVMKLKKILDENMGMPNVKVGTVEQFQGQERRVIIISTVRSTVKHNEFDKLHYLGFLSNPRRFNVAITRARSLLVLVGNPHIICKDPYWDKILRHCSDNNSYQGCSLPERQDFPEVYQADNNNVNPQGERGYPQPSNEAKWGDDEWADPKPSNEVEPGYGCHDPKPSNEAVWADGWGDDAWTPQPSNGNTWGDPQPSNGANWGDPLPSNGANWDDQSVNVELPKPVTDEAEWSDGWKS